MGTIFRWSGKWRRKGLWLNLQSFCFKFLLILCLVYGPVFNVMVLAQQKNSTSISLINKNKNVTDENGSGSWEYYYVDDDDDLPPTSNSTNNKKSTSSTIRTGKYPNSTVKGGTGGSDYYYYMEEEVVQKPKNGSNQGKMIKTTKIKIEGSRKGPPKTNGKGDSLKSASRLPFLGIRTSGFEGIDTDVDGYLALPSIAPFKELATPIDVEGPVYTDNNYNFENANYYYNSGPDTAVGKPLGPGEFPPNPFKEEGQPVLLRPPPEPHATQRPAESVELDIVKQIEYIDGVQSVSEIGGGSAGAVASGEIGEEVNSAIFDDNKNKYNSLLSGKLPNLRTQLKLEAYGSIAPEKNPITKAKEFLYHLWEIITHITTTELLSWAEKGFNLVAELTIPREHYLRVISFAGVYLFLAILTYSTDEVVNLMCTIDSTDKPFKEWRYHAARRYVPARSVDKKLQKHFLKLFRGEKKDEEEDDDLLDDVSGSGSISSEEDLADELDHISELCPEDAFFYSLNPRHIEAYTALQNILVAQDSPKKFLKLAKRLLHKEKVHPKVWYFAIVGAYLARQDLTGFSIAHPLDAIPDWYIPADLIKKHMKSYRKIRIKRFVTNANVTNNSMYAVGTISFSQEEEAFFDTLPLKLPVKSEAGNYTVTIVTANKKVEEEMPTNDYNKTLSILQKLSMPVPSTEEISQFESGSVSVEPREEIIVKKKKKPTKRKPIIYNKKQREKQKQKEKPEQKQPIKVNKVKTKVKNKVKVKVNNETEEEKGDKGELVVKEKVVIISNGNNTFANETILDSGRRKKKRKCIKVNWKVGLDNGMENELWYWREDIMLNQHHWYWHQTHPVNSTQHGDRRAELFFYMHRAIVARYNAERLSNRMKRVKPLEFRDGGIIHSGYNSHLADINADVYWTPRWPHTPLSNIHHEHDPDFAQAITLNYYETLCQRLIKAIKMGKLFPEVGPPIPINHMRGIEPLANTIEAADVSVNPFYYDSNGIHALGHIMVGLSADPDFRFKKAAGVMSDAAVSMRDPAFYSYHLFMDNVFELHKERLPPYEVVGGEFPLLWKGVKIVKIDLHSQGGAPKNELRTFWTHHKFELSPGVDRSIKKGKKKKQVCAQHLDHEPFYFKIVIERQHCVKSKSNQGTVRIFLAPRYDEKGRRIPVKIQRRLMFPLDAFTVKLKVGRNVITRYAEDSSLTQPWTKSFRDLFDRGPDPSGAADFCGCGWPQHLFIPKGHADGMAFDLFVMVTNYDEDYVPNDQKILEIPETCNSPFIFCGLPRRRYPDRRPMGYPFDRPLFKSFNCPPGWTFFSVLCKSANLVINRPLDSLEEYVNKVPNMQMLKIHIRHFDEFFPEPARHR